MFLQQIKNKFQKFDFEKTKIFEKMINRKKISASILGFMTVCAYAPFSIWSFMFLSFFGLNILLNNESEKKQRLIIFSMFSYCFNVVNLHWVGNSFLYNVPVPWLVYAMPLAILIMAGLLTIPYVAVFYLVDKIKDVYFWKSFLLVPIVFVTCEVLRSLTVFGFPWNLVGYSIAHIDVLLQASELGTIMFCSFLILFISSLLAKLQKKYIAIAFVIFMCWTVLGTLRFQYLNENKRQPEILQNASIIQQDRAEYHKFDSKKMSEQFSFYIQSLRLLESKNTGEKTKLIVFPEMSIPYPTEETPNLLKIVRANMQNNEILVFGSPAYSGNNIYNAMYYVTKNDLVRYDKKLRVPFGEFIPLRNIFSLVKNFTNNYKDFGMGERPNIAEVKGNKFLSLVCYEVIFPLFVKRELAGKKDVILMNLTNDAWFYGTIAPYQHALIAKTRAVENGVSIVRAANTGFSFVM
ncbi:MAG: apolipoprotein N-acyltransferase [Proteobacteria bacterium]|nr:apolipoprotein N-acyltransferase [Pseudomonadota bacterium]